MITEAMIIKGLAMVGAWTIGKDVIVPVSYAAGKLVVKCTESLFNQLATKTKKTKEEKVGNNQMVTEQAIVALMAKCK